MKFRHILLAVLAVLAIGFMQPLMTFLGGLTLLLGVGALIFRDLKPHDQDAVERRLLGWLRRTRPATLPESSPSALPARRMTAAPTPVLASERPRRGRNRNAGSPLDGADSPAPPRED